MGTTADQMVMKMQKAKETGADIVEIRFDCLRNLNLKPDLEILLKQSTLPTIVTYRPIWEGGQYEGDETKRQDVLRLAIELEANYVDVELEVAHDFINSIIEKKPDKFKIIVSSHNFHNTPSAEALCNLAARIQATGADIIKIATTAIYITDCMRIFQITLHIKVPTIGVAMGERGLISYLLSPKFGGYLTYGALEPVEQRTCCRCTTLGLYIRPDTKVYGIIGNPVDRSRSPLLYNAAFKEVGLNAVFVHFLVDDVKKFFDTYSSPDLVGFTYDLHLESAVLCPTRRLLLNAWMRLTPLPRSPDGRLIAFNTDYNGAISSIEDALRGL
ncbi:hypothetical protein DITRI_Ditri20bG0055200 [Diplodiscus trichospermus]